MTGLRATQARSWKNQSVAGINRVGFAGEDGKEVVEEWECQAGCPCLGFPETGKSSGTKSGSWRKGHQYSGGWKGADKEELGDEVGFGDSGSAARFFKQVREI
jgi:hypothetical protein